MKKRKQPLQVIGWREWIKLPEFGIEHIKVKVDTGARSSSLHVLNLKYIQRDEQQWARFQVHPQQRYTRETINVEVPILEFRSVRSSSGKATVRPVVITPVEIFETQWPIELTLASRDEMGFRMLLGRQAIKNHFYVDPGRSYYNGRPLKKNSDKRS